ncbi:M6 family metalloprotease domain-containing protein [Streptomyces halobius]|uniref:M6 family metalloprotease domain-containing protein n=1 Tax=Streptomyces halobius TaxID=2879846 RepID=A0ABY4MEV3_9ACTN|nr:M6 family metalloprotease domain-containing protein [Streptomyces halobius]UQA94856.1 M6 family metalloprotease domain-containing protein [Streptomyces halobius]
MRRSQKISAALAASAVATAAAAATMAMDSPSPPSATRPAVGTPPSGPCALGGIRDNVSESATTPAGYARSYGTVKALTLFIDFPDARAPITPRARFAEFFPAVTDYFRASSYGRLDYRPTPLLKWIRMPRPVSEYGIARGATFDPASPTGYYALAEEIVRAADPSVDFRGFDVINVLATPNAGPAATRTVLSVTFSGGDMGLRTADGVPFRNVSFIWSRQAGKSAFRVLNHENAHSFGLPDLYYAHRRDAPTLVGHWDPMDEDWGPSNDFLGWHKWKLGWLAAHQVRCALRGGRAAEHTLSPAAAPDGTKIVVIPTGTHTAFVVEARTRGPLDPAVCRPGVLVYQVATDIPTGHGPLRVVDATPRSRGCFTRDKYVDAGLTDATFRPGATYTDRESGASVTVLEERPDGTYRVRISPARS